jgi:hypothetical protein
VFRRMLRMYVFVIVRPAVKGRFRYTYRLHPHVLEDPLPSAARLAEAEGSVRPTGVQSFMFWLTNDAAWKPSNVEEGQYQTTDCVVQQSQYEAVEIDAFLLHLAMCGLEYLPSTYGKEEASSQCRWPTMAPNASRSHPVRWRSWVMA